MKINGEEIPRGSVREADICVIGAGAAGITLARELIGSGFQVALLEGGALEWTESSQDIYKAASITTTPNGVMDKDFSTWSRLRYFGGSTNHWGGWCRPFEPIDFEKRDWIPLSGWPIRLADLSRDYVRAAELVQMEGFDQKEEALRPSSCGITTREFHYSPPTRFADQYGPELFAAENVEFIYNAGAVRFDLVSDSVESVLVRNLRTEFSIRAKKFVLASGGIENARLLLNSDHQRPAGLGNSSGFVGRCFMEHPHATIGLFVNTDTAEWLAPYYFGSNNEPMRILTTTPEFQARHGLLGFSCELAVRKTPVADPSEGLKFTSFSYDRPQATNHIKLYTRSEMRPELHNRVELSSERDALGLRRVNLNVTFGQEDLRSLVRSTEAVITSLSAAARGRGRITLERDDLWSTDLGPGCHHMGTTRMSRNPREGVVDPNGKVHDVHNLYVAGSSVFSTGGFANPTLTIVALAVRMAEHLRGVGL